MMERHASAGLGAHFGASCLGKASFTWSRFPPVLVCYGATAVLAERSAAKTTSSRSQAVVRTHADAHGVLGIRASNLENCYERQH